MKKTGASLLVYALEQIGVKYTFGIPGVHNTEIYDSLNSSESIEPILVTHEAGASFMADGISRTSDTIGTLCIVPAAGTTHAMSGIGEAFLDGSPMLVISGGTRRDSGRYYQLHQMDLEPLVRPITKGYFLINDHNEIVDTIYKAYNLATSGEPGPVFIEVPVEIQMFRGEVEKPKEYVPESRQPLKDQNEIKLAADLLLAAKNPGMYVGWGALKACDYSIKIAELLGAPVSTTLQGLSSFPNHHPLHVGVGFGASSVPAAQKAFKNCDCMLAVGVRFSELGTGSYGVEVPENLIHSDINPEVFNKNYPAKITMEGDSSDVLKALYEELRSRTLPDNSNADRSSKVSAQIQKDKLDYVQGWLDQKSESKVTPGQFFKALRSKCEDECQMVVDDGKHTFLAAELFEVRTPGGFVSPTDFNCMGFCVPATIGAKLINPNKQVVAIVGDGAFLMTGMELLTAAKYKVGVMVFVFHDGELGQISQFQKIPMNRKTCTQIGDVNIEGVAIATGAHFISMQTNADVERGILEAIEVSASGQPVLVDVNIDYSRKTMLTKGVVKTNLSRFPLNEKVRFLSRAIKRHVMG